MSTDDRMETITDPAEIRATDEPDPFRRNPVRRTGPDDPWRFTRFVADDHECVIVRDEYDEPAPFGSCSTHRRALSSPVALGCTTPAPVGAAVGLNLDAIEARQKAAASARWEIIGDRDGPRALMALLGEDVPALVAEVVTLRANWRAVTTALGYGDGITEPQIGHAEFIAECEREFSEASEWRESQRWRDECHEAGHPDDEDCYEHDPALVLVTLRARLAAVEALAEKRDVLYPPKWAFGAEENYCNGYRQARADFIAALAATGEGQ